MKTSESAKEQIKKFEGLRLNAYRDAGGVWTIGYGHAFCNPHDVVTREEANILLDDDIERIDAILSLYHMTQNQHDALCDFCFNLGFNNLQSSTLWKYVFSRPFDERVKREFRRWVYCDGKPLAALRNRREWEIKRYFGVA